MLTHDELLRCVEKLASAALGRWGLDGADLRIITHSENTTYLVTSPKADRPAILRVHREDYHTVNGIRSELAWIDRKSVV